MIPLIETSPKAYSMQNKSQHDHHTDHHGHQHLQKRTGTHLLETPLLRLPTKKGCISKHFRPNHTGVQFQLQPSLSKQTHTFFSLHCLQAARFSLYECHLNASHLRQDYLQEHARLAAITSNVTGKLTLNNILKAEAASATFCKLKYFAKKEHLIALQRL